MNTQVDTKTLFDAADQFIALANTMAQNDPSGVAGMALRYAAARYSAFEASLMSQNLAADKTTMQEAFTQDFAVMMNEHLDSYIRHLAMQAVPS